MAKIVSFINMKGGVGKTTLSVNIGYTLAKQFGKKVLLIDIDPQMNATQYTLKGRQVQEILSNPNLTIFGILDNRIPLPNITSSDPPDTDPRRFQGIFNITHGFDIIPSHLKTMELNLYDSPFRLRQFIKNKLAPNYDVIILDSPPTVSQYTKIALLSSQSYVVPMMTDYLSLFGLPLLESYISGLKSEFESELDFLGIILNRVRPDYSIYGDVKSKIVSKPEWRTKLFVNELIERTKVTQAFSQEIIDSNRQYLLELNDNELKDNIIRITQEFMQKGRI